MRQQPETRYPYRNPLPFPVAEFVVRPGELGAWVVEDDLRGERAVVGHVSLTEVGEVGAARESQDPSGGRWTAGSGRPLHDLAAVSVLVVDADASGRGLARLLLDVCEQRARELGRTPVLEVLGRHSRAADLYRRRGWREVGRSEPTWLPPGSGEEVTFMVLDPGVTTGGR